MPLNDTVLKNLMKTELAASLGYGPDDANIQDKMLAALAKAIVDHIKDNAVVTVPLVQAGPDTKTGTIA